MLIYWVMYAWVFVIWRFVQSNMSSKITAPDGVKDVKVTKAYCVLLFLVPFFIIALRTGFIDTASYIREFEKIPEIPGSFSNFLQQREKSQLFAGIEFWFKQYISNNPTIWLGAVALLQSFFIFRTLRKYSCDLGMSIFIFISSALVLSWMCNGMRQFIAVCILFGCTDLLMKGKWIIYIPIIIIVMGLAPIYGRFGWVVPAWYLDGIHQSALIMLIACFCLKGKPFNLRVLAVVGVLIVLIVTGSFDDALESSVENTQYTTDLEYVDADTGTSVFRVLVSCVPTILALIARKKIMKSDTPEIIKLSTNASVITSVLYIASAFTSGIFVGRLPIFTEMYNLILTPWLINHAFKANKQIMTTGLILGYTAYFAYQAYTWQGQYIIEF